MKIVNIVDFFYPSSGYENNILSKYMVLFGHEYFILTTQLYDPNGFFVYDNIFKADAIFEKNTGVKVVRINAKKRISGRALWNYSLFKKTLKEMSPDLLFFCGNDSLISILYLLDRKQLNIPILMDSHMLEMASKNKFATYFRYFYRKIVAPIIIKRGIVVIRLQDDLYVQKRLGIPLSQAPWISFGSDTALFYPNQTLKASFRKELGISENAFVFVSTGKLDESKGGLLLANAFIDKFNTSKEVVLVVIGSTAGDYGGKVENLFKESKNKILRFPTQDYNNLAKYYQVSDAAIFAKQCSLSFYDVQACGLVVISEDNSVNKDRNSHGNGVCFKSGNILDLKKCIENIVNLSQEEFLEMSNNAFSYINENFKYEDKAREFEKIMIDVVSNQG